MSATDSDHIEQEADSTASDDNVAADKDAAVADNDEAATDSASAADEVDKRTVPFAESDWHETHMTYDHGKVPLYVAAVWLVSLVGLVVYYFRYGVPDLQSWGMP